MAAGGEAAATVMRRSVGTASSDGGAAEAAPTAPQTEQRCCHGFGLNWSVSVPVPVLVPMAASNMETTKK